jgi:capsular exopolysaccharide synthesis family protein
VTTVNERVVKQLDRSAESPRRPLAPVAAAPIRDGAGQVKIAEQLVSLLSPDSFEADQYRTLRHSVEWLRKESGLHVLAVTSPGPGDGKTITTLNLAGALAQGPDARILVMDADLRRPSVTAYLGLDTLHAPGLADALADPTYDVRRTIRKLDGFNLSVLPAGTPQRAPYELLNSPRLEDLLRQARDLYDFVLVDTPPLVPLPDCKLIGKSVDGFLVVVGAHKTPRRLLADALHLLDPAKVIGVVFNGDDRPKFGYYGYYDYYHTPGNRQRGRWRELLGSGTVLRPRSRE